MNAGKRTLTLGPVLYLWEGEKWRDFYFRIADEAPVSHVVIGETVCSKRLHFTDPYIAPVIERMVAAGKRIVFSTLALVTLERESQYVRSLIADSPYPVEANDLSLSPCSRASRTGSDRSSTSTTLRRPECLRGGVQGTYACRRNCRQVRSMRSFRTRPASTSKCWPSAACRLQFLPAAPMPAPRGTSRTTASLSARTILTGSP